MREGVEYSRKVEELALYRTTDSLFTVMNRKAENMDMDNDRWGDVERVRKQNLS